MTHDLLANPETIRLMIKEAKGYLDAGEIQKARPLLANLASEIEFRTTNIPLATYPAAIKAVTPLIDSGKIDEARARLQVAELLGYGDKKAYQPLYDQLDEIEKKSAGGKSGTGWFDRIKKQLSELL